MDQHEVDQPEGDDLTSPIESSIVVAVSSDRAWDAYVHGMTEWWRPGLTGYSARLEHIEVEPHEGGRIVEHARDGRERVWGEVLEATPGERFAHTFQLTEHGDPTTIAIELEDLPHGGTEVRLSHSGWNDSNREARGKHADWPMLLARFKAYAQHI
ncbi:SRPBCC domain-containing protein [Agrococcus sp. ProA11]|uniref:SRPBCC domain-containing protein n=1 Tax=Agrococcus chionoecetis TaxID=3153752 RepID=UPI0032618F61